MDEPIRVGVSEARQRLPELLRRVEEGQTVLVSRHDLPVARMVPVKDKTDPED